MVGEWEVILEMYWILVLGRKYKRCPQFNLIEELVRIRHFCLTRGSEGWGTWSFQESMNQEMQSHLLIHSLFKPMGLVVH